jgi:hypothetical protein
VTQIQFAEFIDSIFVRVGNEFGIRWHAPENPNHQLHRGDWSKEIRNGYVVDVRRKGYEAREIGGLGPNGLDPKSADDFERELRNVLCRFVEIWEPAYWSLRFPVNRSSFETAHGVWRATLEQGPILAADNDLAFFSVSFAHTELNRTKTLQLFIPLADLGDDPIRNLNQLKTPIIAFLESEDDAARVIFLNGRLARRD